MFFFFRTGSPDSAAGEVKRADAMQECIRCPACHALKISRKMSSWDPQVYRCLPEFP